MVYVGRLCTSESFYDNFDIRFDGGKTLWKIKTV
jgi:hypothetical protein